VEDQELSEKDIEKDIIYNLPTGVVIYDVTGNVVKTPYMSNGFYQMLETTRAERVKARGGNAMNTVHPDDAPGLLAEAHAAIREKRMLDYRYRVLNGKGEYIWVGIRANHIPISSTTERFFTVFYDIDMLVKAQDHDDVLNAILGNVPGGIVVFSDRNGDVRIEYANEGFYEIHHGSKEYWSQQDPNFINWLNKEDANKFRAEFMAVTRRLKQRGSANYRIIGKDGKQHWVRSTFCRAYVLNKVQYYYASITDMDDEMEAIEAMNTATAANKAKSEFLSRMSHDIRTPLNGIIGMTYLAERETDQTKITEYLHNIDVSSKFLSGLINEILDLTRMESSRLDLHPEPYTAEEFSSYTEAVIRPLCTEKGQHLTFEINLPSDYYVLQDKICINRIVFNLLNNAVKYTPEGGNIKYSVSAKVLPGNKKMSMHIEVADNGIGISEEFQKVMFEPFTQEKRSDNSKTNGNGLGLPIVKRLVTAMNGTIKVHSQLAHGTTFIIDFLNDCVPATPMETKEQESQESFSTLQGRHILVCDDHPLNRKIIELLLTKKGMIVDVAEDGQRAINTFNSTPLNYYDAILMDVRMPVMDGLTATTKIRELTRADATTTPIIAMTANVFAEDIAACLNSGMNDHLGKPVEPKVLFATLAKYIK
jgi:signal transduction histidine kinase/ActR/RegA family two-component response regulator